MIHPTAIVHPNAQLASGVEVGAYSVVDEHVEIDEGTRIEHHVVIRGHTQIGKGNRVYQFASLGEAPQDKKYQGEPTRLEIGDGNTIREFCTLNRGTSLDRGVTRLGNDNWIMAYVHLAHDCQVGNHTVFANNVQLAGHVRVDDYAILGGCTVVHQHCYLGAHCLTALGTIVLQDIPPYVVASGNVAKPFGINVEGLKRRGFSAETVAELKRAYKMVYKSGLSLNDAQKQIREQTATCPELQLLLDFISASRRGIVR